MLIDLAPALTAALAPGGRLIAGGIIADQRQNVLAALQAVGLKPLAERAQEDWVVLLLER